MTRVQIVQAIEACGVVAVIRMKEPEKLRAVVDALAEGGVRALEVTMTVPRAIELIGQLAPTLPTGFLLGAGTVLDAETARLAILAGRAVRRRPGLPARGHRDVPPLRRRGDARLLHADRDPGRLGGRRRHRQGVSRPPRSARASSRTCAGPLPQVKLMPTGGVTLDNAGDWIKAGAVAVGVGTALLDAKAIAAGDFDVITANAKRIVANVAAHGDAPVRWQCQS